MEMQNELINTVFEPYQKPSEIFIEDSHQKKKIATNAGKRVGAGGRVMTFGYDLLSAKDRRAYMKGSPVVSYNLNEVMPLNAFKMIDAKKQKELVEHWLNNEVISKNGLEKFWEVSAYTLKKILDPLNIVITNPKIIASINRGKHARGKTAGDKLEAANKKRIETFARRRALREAAEAMPEVTPEEPKPEIVTPAPQIQAEPIAPPPVVNANPVPTPQHVMQQPYYQAPQYMPYMPMIQYAPTPQLAPPTITMNFNVANHPGAVCLDYLNKALAFMHYDGRKIYKVNITVEEV